MVRGRGAVSRALDEPVADRRRRAGAARRLAAVLRTRRCRARPDQPLLRGARPGAGGPPGDISRQRALAGGTGVNPLRALLRRLTRDAEEEERTRANAA